MAIIHNSPSNAINMALYNLYQFGKKVQTNKWQGIESTGAQFAMLQVWNQEVCFEIPRPNIMVPPLHEFWAQHILPNLPWADDHFKERVRGLPINPGEQYKNWPYYRMDKAMRTEGEKFTHTYMERYWPKYAGQNDDFKRAQENGITNEGIRYQYGDLEDIIHLLDGDPYTRQAYLPIWFPEDTGVLHGKRVPCTLGYLFYLDDGKLNINYYIRSCDAIRHFRDDIYLTLLLLDWVLNKLKTLNAPEGSWDNITLGTFTMYMGSFHCFESDKLALRKQLYGNP